MLQRREFRGQGGQSRTICCLGPRCSPIRGILGPEVAVDLVPPDHQAAPCRLMPQEMTKTGVAAQLSVVVVVCVVIVAFVVVVVIDVVVVVFVVVVASVAGNVDVFVDNVDVVVMVVVFCGFVVVGRGVVEYQLFLIKLLLFRVNHGVCVVG